jgi:DeoR family deoxyribose operon repressor
MKKDGRLDQIVKFCESHGFVSYQQLVEALNVSEITIRRDLELLEKLKLIKRERGGASVVKSQTIFDLVHYSEQTATAEYTEEKKRIGKAAVSRIQTGETIIFDSGSTLFQTVTQLPPEIAITAICYGLKIACALDQKEITQLILIGGMYHKRLDMFESIEDANGFKNIRADKAFISAFGVNKNAGLTSGSFFVSSIRKEIINSADKVILLADSSKFGRIECAHFADLHRVDIVITDTGLDQKYIDILNDLDIRTLLV